MKTSAQMIVVVLALLTAGCRAGQKSTAPNGAAAHAEKVQTARIAPVRDSANAYAAPYAIDSVRLLRGRVVLAHEVRVFTPAGDTTEYWIIDRSGRLAAEYDRVTGGSKNGLPVDAELKLRYKGPSDEGFAAEYEGVFEVVEILSVTRAE